MHMKPLLSMFLFALPGLVRQAWSEPLDSALQLKVDAQIKSVQAWASDPIIINAVKGQNARPKPELLAMTQEKWRDLSKLDPYVRSFDRNDAGVFLKGKKTEQIIRAFVSDSEGRKVAFTTKTLTWSHKDDPKHKLPMSGKTWQGPLEQDRASGLEQVQISVPVWDGDKPIGSLVVALNAGKI